MKSKFCLILVATVTLAVLAGTADARKVRTYSGGRGYQYRQPEVDSRIEHWNEARLLGSWNQRRSRRVSAETPLGAATDLGASHSAVSARDEAALQRYRIKLAQRSLRGLGYYRGIDSGTMSPAFEKALRRFQAESGARNSGVVDAATLDSLGLSAMAMSR